MNQPGGATSETTGVVQASGAVHMEGPATQVVMVRLSRGETVQADVLPNLHVKPGDKVRVRMYQRTWTGVEHYEVVAILNF